jgi:hypothetical protein
MMFLIDVIFSRKTEGNIFLPVDVIEDSDTSAQHGDEKRITDHSGGFGGLQNARWPLVPKFAGSNPAENVGYFRAKKSPARLPSEGK